MYLFSNVYVASSKLQQEITNIETAQDSQETIMLIALMTLLLAIACKHLPFLLWKHSKHMRLHQAESLQAKMILALFAFIVIMILTALISHS